MFGLPTPLLPPSYPMTLDRCAMTNSVYSVVHLWISYPADGHRPRPSERKLDLLGIMRGAGSANQPLVIQRQQGDW